MQPAEKRALDQPRPGDVLITKDAGRYFLSVIPHPKRMSFAEFPKALRIAAQWSAATNTNIWQTSGDGAYEPVLPSPPAAAEKES